MNSIISNKLNYHIDTAKFWFTKIINRFGKSLDTLIKQIRNEKT